MSLPFALRGLPVAPSRCGLVLHDLGRPFVCGLPEGHVQRGEPFHMAQGLAFVRVWREGGPVLRGGDVPATPEPASVQLRLDDLRALEGM
jgi:hypothetical protein